MLVLGLPARFPLRLLIAFALGALHAGAFVDDSAWPLEIAALAGIAALAARAARDTTPWRAALGGARVGFGFGFGWFVVGISWIYISLHTYGEMHPLVAGAATLALAAYMAIYPALACALFAAFRQRCSPRAWVSVAAFAALWTLSEIGRGFVFTGFPWLASGYAHVGGPLAGYAPWIGVYGVSLLAALIAATLATMAGEVGLKLGRSARRDHEAPRALLAIAFVIVIPLTGVALSRIEWARPSGAPISVRLLQGNIAQDIKFIEARFTETADVYMKLIEAARPDFHADLIVLPETAFPRFLNDLPDALTERLVRDANQAHAAIAFGVPIEEGGGRYYNSVIGIAPTTTLTTSATLGAVTTQRYDKSHLVPFSEFIPFGFRWFVDLMKMPLGDFTRGALDQKPMLLAGNKVAFNICYEDLFGEEIIRQAGDANILVNVSNLAWFGDSMALPQHLAISRMRAIETARPMLRATNTGMTAAIDPHGRVVAQLAPFTAGALDVKVQGMSGLTPFDRFGNAPVALLIALMLSAAGVATTRTAKGANEPVTNPAMKPLRSR